MIPFIAGAVCGAFGLVLMLAVFHVNPFDRDDHP